MTGSSLWGHGHVIPRPDRNRMRCGGPRSCRVCQAEQEAVQAAAAERGRDVAATAGLYRERAALVAYAAADHPGQAVLAYSDPATPDWPVITITGRAGQMCWHICPQDVDLFPHVPWGTPPPWDGHDTTTKYRRLAALVAVRALG